MSAQDQIVRLNRTPYSWSDSKFKVNNTQFIGFTKIGLKQKREREKVKAATQDGRPLGMTDGMYELESMTWTLLASSWDIMTTFLAALAGGRSYGDARFSFTAQVSNPRLRIPVLTHLVSECAVKDEDNPFENSQGQIVVNVTLDALYMTTNNKQLFADKPGVL